MKVNIQFNNDPGNGGCCGGIGLLLNLRVPCFENLAYLFYEQQKENTICLC